MPTLKRRIIRRVSKFLFRLEPWAIFGAYICIAGAAFFSWFHPLTTSFLIDPINARIQAILLTVGALLVMIGHVWKKEVLELLGLVCSVGGMFIFQTFMVILMQNGTMAAGQVLCVGFIGMGLMFSRAFKLQDAVTLHVLGPPPSVIIKKYYS